MNLMVMGAGGVGGYGGARLAAADNDVTFVARAAHLGAMRTHGLRLDSVASAERAGKVLASMCHDLLAEAPLELARRVRCPGAAGCKDGRAGADAYLHHEGAVAVRRRQTMLLRSTP